MSKALTPEFVAALAKMKPEEQAAAIAAYNAANRTVQPAVTAKVSEKGAVSVYGLQRFPVTLYADQWRRLIQAIPSLEAFLEANKDKLSVKGQ